ncbi:hypothetical protein E2562_017683 [Oryza meyeriana var. granulata]|uniref:CCHC-type domain-containing protein n=1 Tax=Oryza meyeriana var. granulata TaxID=110450 RepID=A0A6G1BXG8_9ORYZ|nr:hypothetical protein E2562_017683 [Oryza meyeriana var. granulata]
MLQLHEVHDEVLNKNYVSRPQGRNNETEANAGSFKVRKNCQRKRGKGGKKVVWAYKVKPGEDGKANKEVKPYGEQNQTCFKCGTRGHWSQICKAPKHVIEAHQRKKKAQKEQPEAHFTQAVEDTVETPTSKEETPMETCRLFGKA